MVNILFYHANTLHNSNLENSLFLSIAAVYMKTYLETNHSDIAKQLNWLRPLQKQLTDKQLIDYCNDNKVDLLCLSIYLWNETFVKQQISRIKTKLPSNCKIVVGGPSVNVNINSEFFDQHGYADYAVYGPGEEAFADLINHLVQDKKLIAFNVSNLAWIDRSKDRLIISDFKNVSQSKVSPFLHNKEFFVDMVRHEIENNNYKVILPYELTRGCPYSCTFCDWNSGLSTKVSRRKDTYKDEIDLFQQIGIRDIYFSDANFGQYEEDIELVKYMVHKNLNENANFKTDGNLSKLRKDNNLKIYHLFAEGDLIAKGWGFTFSVQDINETVLKHINRPDVGWEVHKSMIQELHEKHPEYIPKVQIIIGLPGQTPTSIRKTCTEIVNSTNAILCPFVNEILPASPAELDPEYQKKFQYKYSNSERVDHSGFLFRGKFPESCFSFSRHDFVEMIVLTSFITGLSSLKQEVNVYQAIKFPDINLLVDKFLQSKQYKMLVNNLYNNWVNNDQFFYTVDFDGKEKTVVACNMSIPASLWMNSISFKRMLAEIEFQNVDKNKFLKVVMHKSTLEGWYADR